MKKTKEKRKKNWEKQKGDENNGEVMSLMRPYMLGNPPSVRKKRKDPFWDSLSLFFLFAVQIALSRLFYVNINNISLFFHFTYLHSP